MMAPNPICPRCHGDFVEQIEPENDPRDFIATAEEDEMENEFGGAGTYNQNIQTLLQDMLTHIMGRQQTATAAAVAAAPDGAESGAAQQPPGSGLPSDNIFRQPGAAAEHDGGTAPQPEASSPDAARRLPNMRTWTSSSGNTRLSFSVGSFSAEDMANLAAGAGRRSDVSDAGDNANASSAQSRSSESQRRPMFIDPEENAPLNLGNFISSLLGALGGAPRGGGAGGGGGAAGGTGGGINPIFGVPMGNLGDYVWGQNSLDDIITRIMEQNTGTNAPPPASEDQILKLPKRLITEDEVARHIECGICMEEYKVAEEVLELPCAHFYHRECIDHWLKMNGTCPICRKRIEDEHEAEGAADRAAPREHSELPGSYPVEENAPPLRGDGEQGRSSAPEPESEPLD
ncbi:hypothetical protein GGI07_000141 [Coemansia sp. Benny D115]|nr:hypothetical protein GGI07_000141 [Coemansia sp. Benny D115]